jgi:hypothetical protein
MVPKFEALLSFATAQGIEQYIITSLNILILFGIGGIA